MNESASDSWNCPAISKQAVIQKKNTEHDFILFMTLGVMKHDNELNPLWQPVLSLWFTFWNPHDSDSKHGVITRPWILSDCFCH